MSRNLGSTDCPECFNPFAATKIHFGNEDRSIRIDSFNNCYMSHAPSEVGPCIRLHDCTDGRRIVDFVARASCSVIPVVCVAPIVADRFAKLLTAFENIPCAFAPVVVVGAV